MADAKDLNWLLTGNARYQCSEDLNLVIVQVEEVYAGQEDRVWRWRNATPNDMELIRFVGDVGRT